MTTDLEELDEQQPQQQDSPVIADLRKKADRVDTAEAEAEAAKRELTLHRAGLDDLSPKKMSALLGAHEGDWDAESLKATATELGFVGQSEAEPEPKVPQQELDAMARVAEAAGGEPPARTDLDSALEAAKDDPEQMKAILRNADLLIEDD